MILMEDIKNRADIERLVNRFYDKIGQDATIGFFFTDIAKVDWNEHLPKMYNFWQTLLFGEVAYKGNPMGAHFPLNEVTAMEKHHFEHWLKLWSETIEELYSGSMAETAKYKASNIANLMSYKMEMARRL